jgi:2,4-diaminopentanoate dehydrogenase
MTPPPPAPAPAPAGPSSSPHDPRLRVIQWTTGKTGTAAVRALAHHPALRLVGCYAWSSEKVGRDAGELCGIAPVGVIATDDVDALLALQADCVSYMPYRPDFDHLAAILESGTNVVTTMYMLAGTGYGPEATERIADAARRGGSSLYASGVYPGHAPMVALAASAMCARIDRISVLESLDMSGYANEKMFRSMGIDLDVDDPQAPKAVEAACGSFRDQIAVMAHALAVDLDSVDLDVQFATADDRMDLGYMIVEKGRIAGFKGVISGWSGDRPVIQCQFVWKLGSGMTPEWPVEKGYVIEIEGEPGVRCRLEPLHDHFDGAMTTALPVVNAIPAACAAPPGIVNQGELPLVRAAHLVV